MAQLLTFSFLLLALSSTPSFGQDAVPANNHAEAPAKPSAKQNPYPRDRNFLAERVDLISKAQEPKGAKKDDDLKNPDNDWPYFVATVAGLEGALQVAHEGNAITNWIAADKESSGRVGNDILDAASGRLKNAPPELIAEGRAFLDLLERSRLCGVLDYLYESPLLVPPECTSRPEEFARSTNSTHIRTGMQLCIARMRYAAVRGDEKAMIRAYKNVLTIARAASFAGDGLSRAASYAGVATGDSYLIECLRIHPCTLQTLEELFEISCHHRTADWQLAMNCERLLILDTIDYVHQSPSKRLLEFYPNIKSEIAKNASSFTMGLFFTSRERSLEIVDSLFDTLTPLSGLSRREARPYLEKYEKIAKSIEENRRHKLISVLVPNTLIWQFRLAETGRSGLRVVLAVEVYRKKHGKLPDSLEDLKPILGDVSIADRYELDNKPVRYIRSDAEPGYVVYSVAGDGDDQGGKLDPENPRGGTAPGNPVDFIINYVEPSNAK